MSHDDRESGNSAAAAESPMDEKQADSAEKLGADLNQETAVIAWSELVRHFARGVVIHVTAELDLVDAAVRVAQDETDTVQRWLDSGLIRRASDDDARDWTSREPEFWCVVTAPWVLVQERRDGEATPRRPGNGQRGTSAIH